LAPTNSFFFSMRNSKSGWKLPIGVRIIIVQTIYCNNQCLLFLDPSAIILCPIYTCYTCVVVVLFSRYGIRKQTLRTVLIEIILLFHLIVLCAGLRPILFKLHSEHAKLILNSAIGNLELCLSSSKLKQSNNVKET
jgi:hypothetical protein